ncbi:E3 ubiquitin-protein ligase listerin [Microplitis demolitor]|uniref:E3 ubiquitin-protein ligase listerin n=1 Tax=Microplitis demolitor TaxID=69319 RepID=UPI0006D4F59E|nr:E3 ubiquitin-protein ligase listerin [Microplitis demolitor]
MGKNKAQRTKNNAKPSNSARSAEFLGSAMPNFVGFSAVKDGGYVPVLPGLSLSQLNEVEISAIDSNFQVVFKKMNKKDATTKFKALQEFADLVRESPLSTVEAVLPFWPKLYSTLAVDAEHRVRDAAQTTHGVLVKKVGKSIATYLKQLAGPWFTSQFDPFPPAASAASNSLHETFPDKKYADAIVYCQDEILSYICHNINVQTPQLLNITYKSMNLSPEILEAKYQRILICSLQGYCSYLKQVSSQQIEKTANIHHQIINGSKFWKLAKHEIPLIKISFFNIITSLIENCKEILKDTEKKTITSIMNSLDENEPGVISAVWECMLIAIDKIDDWYTHVSIEKLVLPKLWRVLRSGGQGCASIIYPNLLPLISQFPKFNLDKKILFFNFFDNMSQGFSAKNVLISRSELTAITKSFIECMRYTILLNNSDIDLCGKLVREQLIPAIEACVKDYTPVKLILFNEAAELIRYWSKNRDTDDYKSYGELLSIFWCELESMFNRFMESESDMFEKLTINSIYDAQIKLLTALKCPPGATRKSLRIKFKDTDPAESKEQLKIPQTTDDVLLNEINNFVSKLCVKLINNHDKNPSNNIEHLNKLICQFESKLLFEEISKVYTSDNNLFELYDKILKVWLTDDTKVNDIIKIIFILMQYMKDEDKNRVLNSLTSINNSKILNCAITYALNNKNMDDKVIKSWCKTDYTTEYLCELARKINDDNCEENKIILLQAFKSCDNDFCISEEAVNGVLNILCDYLTESEEITESLVAFISQLSLLIWNFKKLTSVSLKMFKALFKISSKDSLSFNLKESIQNNWVTGLTSIYHKIPADELFELQDECMKIIYEKMYSSDFRSNDETDLVFNFLEASNDYNYDEALVSLIRFNNNVEKIFLDEWIIQVKNIILHTEIVSGNFYSINPIKSVSLDCPIGMTSDPEEEEKEIPDKMARCLKWSLFTAKLINRLLMKLNDEYEDDEFESIVKNSLDNSSQQFNNIIMITSLGKLYNDHYKFSTNGDLIKQIYVSLHFECKSLREKMPPKTWKEIIIDSLDVDKYWAEYGSIFSLFLQYSNNDKIYLSEIKSQAKDILREYTASEDSENSMSLIQNINAVILAQIILDDDDDNNLSLDVLKKIIKRNQVDKEFLLFNRDISSSSWSEFVLPLELIRLLTKLLEKIPTKMTTEMRDAAVIYLSSWLVSLNKSIAHHNDLKLQCFVVALSQLFCAIKNLLTRVTEKDIEEIFTGFSDEWNNIFADDINREIANTWMYYADLFNKKTEFLTPILMLNYLGNAIKLLDGNVFFKEPTDALITVTSDDLIKFSLKLILSPIPNLQLSAHYALNRLIPTLVDQDKNTIEQENFDTTTLNIHKFEDTILQTQKIVDTMLSDFKLSDSVSCTVKPYTDSYTYTFGYILTWINVLEMCSHAHADLRYQYGEILKNYYFSSLMNNIFRLMPAKILESTDRRTPLFEFVNLFKDQPLLNLNENLTSCTLDHIVCWVYINCLRYMPVLARQWWSAAETRVGSIMEKITTLYVSPVLCREELTINKLNDVPNLTIIVYPTVRELNAVYRMDDSKLELKIILPINYPLGTVTVEPRQHVGGAGNWKNSHMQLSIFLNHQNGSIWDGLMMWKNNLDKKFSGVEECYICFSIFHINTYQIPKLSCHTCRKKFHAPCLYKWFSTSQKSTCPICRNIF